MKVLFINSVYERGSTGRIVKSLGEVLKKQGHSYVAAYGRGDRSNDPHSYYIGNKASVYLHALLSRITDRSGFYSKVATKKLVSFIREYEPDVIHLHNLHGYYVNVQVLFDYLKNEYKGKVVWTLHDCWAFTGHCVHYTYVKCSKWKTKCHHCPEKGRYPVSLVADGSRVNYERKKRCFLGVPNLTIVTPSRWLANQVSKSFLKEYPCCVVNNGVDLQIFAPCAEEKDEKLLLNVVDGLDDRKGYSDLVRLMELLPAEYKLVLVGVAKADVAKVSSAIMPILRTNSAKELAEYYSRAAWLLNPTYEDTFPTVNIEALACGTPVITYSSGGSAEIIDESCGYSVEAGDIKVVAELILQGKRMDASLCRKRAEAFDASKKFLQYAELYRKLQEGD